MKNTHSFNVELAQEIGLEGAILLQHFYYWYQNNRDKEQYHKDNRIWTYNSYPNLSKIFPYFTIKQIKYRIEKMVSSGYLVKGNYNKLPYDRTNWYSLSDKSLKIFGEYHEAKLAHALDNISPCIGQNRDHALDNISPSIGQNLAMTEGKISSAIPYIDLSNKDLNTLTTLVKEDKLKLNKNKKPKQENKEQVDIKKTPYQVLVKWIGDVWLPNYPKKARADKFWSALEKSISKDIDKDEAIQLTKSIDQHTKEYLQYHLANENGKYLVNPINYFETKKWLEPVPKQKTQTTLGRTNNELISKDAEIAAKYKQNKN